MYNSEFESFRLFPDLMQSFPQLETHMHVDSNTVSNFS